METLDAQLLEILACPDTHHAPLRHDPQAGTLTCTECGRVFPIVDGIPVLLLDEADGGPPRHSGDADRAGPAGEATAGERPADDGSAGGTW